MPRARWLAGLVLIAAIVPGTALASRFTVQVSLDNILMSYNSDPLISAHTRIGASCTAWVVYTDGKRPAISKATQKAGKTGILHWRWHQQTKAAGGVAEVDCTFKGQSAKGQVTFSVV